MVLPMWVFWVALVAMIFGLLGVFLPLVPGVGFIWLVVLVYAVAEGFATIDPITFSILTVLGAIGFTTDLWMSQLGSKIGGASFWSLLAGMGLGLIGTIIGLALGLVATISGLPFLDIIAAPCGFVLALAGVFLVEWRIRGDWREALKAGGGWLVGCTLSGIVQSAIGILMIIIFVWQALAG